MRRGAIVGCVVVLAAGLIGLVVVGLTRGSDLVYTLGTRPAGPVVGVTPGQVGCQGPIGLPDGEAFDRVAFTLGTLGKPGPEVAVEVREVDGGRRLASGTLPAGYADGSSHVVDVGRVATDAPLEVCLRNVDVRSFSVYGQSGVASPRTSATVDGKPVTADMALTLTGEHRSLLALLPTMADRASLFRAGWVGPFTYLVLGLLVVLGVPLLLVRGLGAAAAADDDEPSAEQRDDEPPVAPEERPQEARPAGTAQER